MTRLRRSRAVLGRRRPGVGFAILLSLLLHGALVGAAFVWGRPEPPQPQVIELQTLDLGEEPVDAAPELPPAPEVAPRTPAPARRPRPAAPTPEPREPLPVAEVGTEPQAVVEARPEPAPPQEAPPSTFLEWQQAKRAPFSELRPSDVIAEGPSGGSRHGVDRCEAPAGRRVEVLYLLFDSSGSMSRTSGPNALTCAHQVAKAAIDGGASVVVGNFARQTAFAGPTRSMLDVEIALRSISDGSATILPSRELQPYLDQHAGADADLVIVSDGIFGDDGATLPWYEYFLELNPDNRGRMYTVGGLGQRESVRALRRIGFDVYSYEPL